MRKGMLTLGGLAATAALATGCFGGGPAIAWLKDAQVDGAGTGPGKINVALNFTGDASTKKSQYKTQYVAADVDEFVVGLFDAVNDVAASPNDDGRGLFMGFEYLGATVTNIPATVNATTPTYMEVLAGTAGTIGRLRNGGAEVNGSNGSALTRANLREGARWLITKRSVSGTGLDTANKTPSFGNLKPGTNRYYLFAAAFLRQSAATESHVAGYNQAGPITIGSGQTVSQALTVTLNFNLGQLNSNVTVTDATPSAGTI